jgi:tRNA threonylcarbamoyladenosine biosynthesis protein TsaE
MDQTDTSILLCPRQADLPAIAQKIIEAGKTRKIWLFEGEMGAGKTTTIREICRLLGVHELVNSPTFALINEYRTQSGNAIYHFDFYRISSDEEALDIGCEDYFYSGDLCLIEWPSKIQGLIPAQNLHIHINFTEGNQRLFKLTLHGQSKNRGNQ